MGIENTAEIARRFAQVRKERLGEQMDQTLLVIRDGRVVAAVRSDDVGALLRGAQTAAAGYGADALALVVEALVPVVPTNPATGAAWARGEAEQAWLDGGVEKGWVTEVQILVVATRGGETTEEVWAYRLVGRGEDEEVVWGEQVDGSLSTGLSAALADLAATPAIDAARVPDPGEGFRGDPVNGPFFPPEQGRVSLDVGTTRILERELPDICFVADSDEHAEQLMGEGLRSWQLEVRG